MVNYPVKFKSRSTAQEGAETWKTSSPEGLEQEMSPPEEFGGSERNPSPETLFCASLDSCVAATFKAIAERKGLEYKELETETNASLDRGEDSRPMITEASVEVDVKGIKDFDEAEQIAETTKKNCFIHHSIQTEVNMNFDFYQ